MTKQYILAALTLSTLYPNISAFTSPLSLQTQQHPPLPSSSSSQLPMGIFDDLQLIFSDEGRKNRQEYEERERAEQAAAQKEIFERRRNPAKMAQYEAEVRDRRQKLMKDKDVWKFQQEVKTNEESGKVEDPLEKWNELREEGAIKVGSDLERDPSSSRLGSEGLVDVRTDELLPYIDQGYVDEEADVMGNVMNIFGGKKKKD